MIQRLMVLRLKKDDFMGIAEKKIVSSGADMITVTKELFAHMLDQDSEIVTLLQGEDANDEQTALLIDFLEQEHPDVEVDVHKGDQPLYSYIISVE